MSTPFAVRKIGHAVVFVSDLDRSRRFYTEVLGFKVSDTYPGSMMSGGMVFLRCNGDHHCLALVGDRAADAPADKSLHHLAFELATLDEVFRARDHLKKHGAKLVYEGRRRAGCQVSVEFLDPDGHHLELYWGVDQIGSDGRSRPSEEWRQTATLEDAVRIAPPGQDMTLHDAALRARVEAGTDRPQTPQRARA
jgi:catechol 2,3-dioxygenase-like lactoylglutathione lyase family enzyme